MGTLIFNKKIQEDVEDLIKKLLNSNESIRLGSKGDYIQVINHPWFNNHDLSKSNEENINYKSSNSVENYLLEKIYLINSEI